MYAFTPLQCDAQPECYVELSRPMHHPGFGIHTAPRGNWHLRRYQSREVFHIACKTLGVDTAYAIAKTMKGASFTSYDPPRWWGKLRNGFDLVRALARKDHESIEWMDMLLEYTDEAKSVLAMPLWKLSEVGSASVSAVMSWRPAVEAMGVPIPQFPGKSKVSSTQYVKLLSAPLRDRKTMWAGINVAVFCLRLAQARGNLALYALTYETLIGHGWPWFASERSELGNLLLFYGEWFSTLQLQVFTEADLIGVEEELTAYGLSVDIRRYSQSDDPRYALANSLFDSEAGNGKKSLVLRVSISQ